MPRIAETRAGFSRRGSIQKQDLSSLACQGESRSRADYAGADHGDHILLTHGSTVYDLRSCRQPIWTRFMTKPFPCSWSGVFPAATTQFDASMQVDLPATQKVQKALLDD